MPETKIKTEPGWFGRWLRKLIRLGVVLVILLVLLYFVVTSGIFFTGVILPRIGSAIELDLSAADAQISPFSHVMVRDLKAQAKRGEPLLKVHEVRASYNLRAILGGDIVVQEEI